jgi:hypothetical protein
LKYDPFIAVRRALHSVWDQWHAGTSRGLLTFEQRFYTDWYPFRLARFGAAVFGDVGRT